MSSVGRPRLAARPPRRTAWDAARKGRRWSMQRPPRRLVFVFESLDLFPQFVAFLTVPIPILIRAFVLAPQPFDLPALLLDFTLLPLELRDQFVARRRAPSRLHASFMARSRKNKDK
jgi:hypothetical protein